MGGYEAWELLFEISIQFREKRLSPRRAPGRSLLPLSPKRTQVRLKSLLYLVWLTPDKFRTHGRPSVQECRLRLKRPTPNASRRFPLFKSSTAARSCSYGLFPWAALLRFAFGQKIWHTIFFSPQANFKIFPKLLLRRGASQFPKSWRVTVHPRYRGHSSVCKKLYAKGQSRLEAVGSEVDAACDFGGLRRVANDNLRSG